MGKYTKTLNGRAVSPSIYSLNLPKRQKVTRKATNTQYHYVALYLKEIFPSMISQNCNKYILILSKCYIMNKWNACKYIYTVNLCNMKTFIERSRIQRSTSTALPTSKRHDLCVYRCSWLRSPQGTWTRANLATEYQAICVLP